MLISEKDLLNIFDCSNWRTLKRALEKQGVVFLEGTGGKCATTLQAINKVLINEVSNDIEFLGQDETQKRK